MARVSPVVLPFPEKAGSLPIPGLPGQPTFRACSRPRVTLLPPHRLQVLQNNQRFCGPLTLIVRPRDEGIRATPSLCLFLRESACEWEGWCIWLGSPIEQV